MTITPNRPADGLAYTRPSNELNDYSSDVSVLADDVFESVFIGFTSATFREANDRPPPLVGVAVVVLLLLSPELSSLLASERTVLFS